MKDEIIQGDCIDILKGMPDQSIDLVVTDPPYGISFMSKNWDKALPSVEVWRECLRVLKPGAFAFVMCIPRQDCLSRMIINLEDAGFMVNFTSLLHCFATGFPKAANLSKLADRRAGAEREVVGTGRSGIGRNGRRDKRGDIFTDPLQEDLKCINITAPATPEAKALDGSFAGFSPKPAYEVVIVVMRPLAEKTYLDQALANGHGATWLDSGRIPYASDTDYDSASHRLTDKPITGANFAISGSIGQRHNESRIPEGRFAPNLLVSDDVLNDGRVTKSVGGRTTRKNAGFGGYDFQMQGYGDSGSYSRYFSLDAWAEANLSESVNRTFPFLIVPKASRSEKNAGLDEYLKYTERTELCYEENMALVILLKEVTSESTLHWSIGESGKNIMALCLKDSASTISTEISKIIESRILQSLTSLLTSGSTQDVKSLTGNGGSHARNVVKLRKWLLTTTKGNQESARGVSHVALQMLLTISANADWQDYKNVHSTVKPIKLMSYLIAIGSRPGDVVLDPYAGTCTTGIAAALLDRRYICIEQDADGDGWCDIGRRRIAWHVEQAEMEMAVILSFSVMQVILPLFALAGLKWYLDKVGKILDKFGPQEGDEVTRWLNAKVEQAEAEQEAQLDMFMEVAGD